MMAAVLLVGGLVVVPGAGASLALAPPGAITVEGRIGLVFGLGYGVVAGVATALALAHVFSRPAFIVGVVLATVGGVAAGAPACSGTRARREAGRAGSGDAVRPRRGSGLAPRGRGEPSLLSDREQPRDPLRVALLVRRARGRLRGPRSYDRCAVGHRDPGDGQQARAEQLRGRRLLLPRARAASRDATGS